MKHALAKATSVVQSSGEKPTLSVLNQSVRLDAIDQFRGFANPLLMYLLHNLFLAIFVLPPLPQWYESAPLWLVVLEALGFIGALTYIGRILHRKGWIVSL